MQDSERDRLTVEVCEAVSAISPAGSHLATTAARLREMVGQEVPAGDYMKEAERLLSEYGDAVSDAVVFAQDPAGYSMRMEEATRAAMLAHIQRGAVPEGWQLVPKEPTPEMQFPSYMGSDRPNWPERQAIYKAMLAAAPDHFRDAGEMVPVHCTPTEHEGRIVYEHTSEPIPNADGFVLYAPVPDQFRNAAKMMAVQPSCMTCSGHGMIGGLLPNGGGYESDPCPDCTAPAPAEVPMPEPARRTYTNAKNSADVRKGYALSGEVKDEWWDKDQMLTYGVACRAAGEAAGYARGLADERERICAAIKAEDDYCVTEGDYMLDSDDCIRVARGTWERPDYALRGEVKP